MESESKGLLLQSPKGDFISYWTGIPIDILSLLIDYLDELKDVYKFLSDPYVKEKLCTDENNSVWENKFKRDFSEYIELDHIYYVKGKREQRRLTIMKKYLKEKEYLKFLLKDKKTNKKYILEFIINYGYEKLIKNLNIPIGKSIDYLFSNACCKGRLHIIKWLMDLGANIDYSEDPGILKNIKLICGSRNIQTIEYFRQMGYTMKEEGKCGLEQCIRVGDIKCADYFIKNGADINSVNFMDLDGCVRDNDFSMIQFIFNKGYNNLKCINSLLYTAIEYKNIDIVKFLLNYVDVHYNNEYFLLWAIDNENKELVKILIEKGANVELALKEASRQNHYGAFSSLYELYHSINYQ